MSRVKLSTGFLRMGAGLLCVTMSTAVAYARRPHGAAQAAAVTNPGHVVGAATAISGSTMSVRTDAGLTYAVAIPAGARLLRVAPGDKDLSNAQKIAASDVGVGDRVLVRLAAGATIPFDATSVIDIPHAAIVAKQREEQMAWQRHGVGGLVKSVDAANGVIVITSGTGAAAKEETLKVTPATVLRRYAPDSVDYARATAAPISAIRPGDQLRALLAPDTAGPDKTVREAVSGSFRNIAGKISSVNAKDQTITLRDLMTKKNVTVHIGPTSQMKKLTDEQAKLIAASTTAPGTPGATHAPMSGGEQGAGAWQRRAAAAPGAAAGTAAGGMRSASAWAARAGGNAAAGDPQQIIRQAAVIQIRDLRKGDAVMLVGTAGDGDVSAITLLVGVEPLLESSASTQNALMAGWSMGSGEDEASSSSQ